MNVEVQTLLQVGGCRRRGDGARARARVLRCCKITQAGRLQCVLGFPSDRSVLPPAALCAVTGRVPAIRIFSRMYVRSLCTKQRELLLWSPNFFLTLIKFVRIFDVHF